MRTMLSNKISAIGFKSLKEQPFINPTPFRSTLSGIRRFVVKNNKSFAEALNNPLSLNNPSGVAEPFLKPLPFAPLRIVP